METFSALLVLSDGNPPYTGRFPSQRPVTRSFDVFFDMHLNKQLSEQSRRRWFETPSRSLWCHCNGTQERHPIAGPWGQAVGCVSWVIGQFYPCHCHVTGTSWRLNLPANRLFAQQLNQAYSKENTKAPHHLITVFVVAVRHQLSQQQFADQLKKPFKLVVMSWLNDSVPVK